MLREQIVLGLPLRRLCREDCLGRCPSCGQNRNQVSCDLSACRRDRPIRASRLLRKLFQKN